MDAAEAAEGEVTFFGDFVCDSAEPAADFAALLAFGLLSTLDAAEAARLPVVSLFFDIFWASWMKNFGHATTIQI